nr:hypothetical protein [Amanita sp. CQC-2022a]WIF29663.1 hypothetical protein [Amanita sp. CQC-2022a]
MNKTLKDTLVGVLLGDASIRRSGLNKNKASITFEQSSKKLEYKTYLQNLNFTKEGGLELTQDELRMYSREDLRYQTINKNNSLSFNTKPLEELKLIADLFLDESGKTETEYLLILQNI